MLPQPGETSPVGGWIVRNEGDGYGVRARRFEASPATEVVVVEWTHPNYGYWADAGVFIKFAHAAGWESIGAACWFDFDGKDSFVSRYPDFAVLFQERLGLGERVQLPETPFHGEDNGHSHC